MSDPIPQPKGQRGRTRRASSAADKAQKKCLLCHAPLSATAWDWLYLHPEVTTCSVRVTNTVGLSIDDLYGVDEQGVFMKQAAVVDDVAAMSLGEPTVDGFTIGNTSGETGFVSIDHAARQIFEAAGLPFLGGMSGPRGWSSISTYQLCPYLWHHTYGGGKVIVDEKTPKGEALEIGTIVHTLLAIHYSKIIDPAYPLTMEDAFAAMQKLLVTASWLAFAWKLVQAYLIEHSTELEWMKPLAVEYLAADPSDGTSCRWDLVFEMTKPMFGNLPGVYVCNTKTARDNSRVTREQWKNDGQILGEVGLYQKLKYEKRWGKLRGACINIIIKTTVPQFYRSWVYPTKQQLRSHEYERSIWIAQMELAKATGLFPRSRASCVTKWHGLCNLFDHCAGADAPRSFE